MFIFPDVVTSSVTRVELNGRTRNQHALAQYGMREISFVKIDANQGEVDCNDCSGLFCRGDGSKYNFPMCSCFISWVSF